MADFEVMPQMSMRQDYNSIINNNATQQMQDKYLQANIDNMQWNKWLNGAGIGMGTINTYMNIQNAKDQKRSLEKNNAYLDEKMKDLSIERAIRDKFRSAVAKL